MEKRTPQTKVKVVVRVRPTLKDNVNTCVTAGGNTIQIVNHRNKEENLQYEFSSVYHETASQQIVFTECVEPLLKNAFQGQNVSVFAYGPTGAGKTHTMLGVLRDPGIIPRTVKSLFSMISEEVETAAVQSLPPPQHSVTFSYLEIYNEKVKDLLVSGSTDLPIREDASHNIFVSGLTEKAITDFEAFKDYFGPATSNRTVAATKLNECSSRSHSILMLKVLRKVQGRTYRGKIYLIDLAGSEDNRRTGNSGMRLKESFAINKSLFVLGEVVDAINHNQIRIPYRNSKLTRLLQDSIGGSCHSVMITNIAPEQHYYYDTYCTLNFATKSKKIVNVNTASVKDESPPASAKPTAKLPPAKRRSDVNPLTAAAKRARRSSGTPGSELPSPMLRRQTEFESVVNEKLKEMERLMKDMKHAPVDVAAVEQLKDEVKKAVSSASRSNKLTSSQSTPSIGTSRSRRSSLRSVSSTGSERSPNVICPTPTTEAQRSGLKDKTNILYQHYLLGKGKRSRLTLKKVKDAAEPSCSPLFPGGDSGPQKKNKKRKGSVADSPVTKKVKAAPKKFENQEQSQRDSDFLSTLNSASVKDLQQLQTVGKKRAQLIYDWRQLHGAFDCVDGLKEIPGFTDKYIQNLLRSNLISHAKGDDEELE
ncbi:kinesin-like protein KIF22 [Aplysia californica]|uniref:Kinesin-like protein n=1 Tax=Aplysia californica TaxID=6500 RepID=A0ABM0ZYK8_APLCA|nr:kinesin-like protein KIF22 [Aplysia californica]